MMMVIQSSLMNLNKVIKMLKKLNVNNFTIGQCLLLFVTISFIIFYMLFDRDLSLSNDIKKAYSGKNTLYFISNNYEKFKEEFNIIEVDCKLIFEKPYIYEPRETILLSNEYKTKEEVDKFIFENPKTFKELEFFYNEDLKLNKILSKCLKDNKNKPVIEYILENLDKNKQNYETLLNTNKNFNCFNLQTNQYNRVSKNLGFSFKQIEKESYFIKKINENVSILHNIKFCE